MWVWYYLEIESLQMWLRISKWDYSGFGVGPTSKDNVLIGDRKGDDTDTQGEEGCLKKEAEIEVMLS